LASQEGLRSMESANVPVCLKSKCTDFLFNYLLDLPEITRYLLQSMTLGKLHSGSSVSSTDHSSTVSFSVSVFRSSVTVFVCFLSSRNDDPSTSISTLELDLGCREDEELRECFSTPEILELKAQFELARYRGAAPSCLQCPFGLTGRK
jgi:hypothetical protein